jgi:hypothetical protein
VARLLLCLTPSGRRRRREAQERLSERARQQRERYRSVDVERRLGAVLEPLRGEARIGKPASSLRSLIDPIAPDNTGDVAWASEWSSTALDPVIPVLQAAESAEDPTAEAAAGVAEYEVEAALALCDDDVDDPLVWGTLELMARDIADLRAGELARVKARTGRASLPERARRRGE